MNPEASTAIVEKDCNGALGMSLGGGSPLCPCVYAVALQTGMPVATEGSIQIGDEISEINGVSLEGLTRFQVAEIIQHQNGPLSIGFKRFDGDTYFGKKEPLDVSLKKLKQKLSLKLKPDILDTFGIEHAFLQESEDFEMAMDRFERTCKMYDGLLLRIKTYVEAFQKLLETQKEIGVLFANSGIREDDQHMSKFLSAFGKGHQKISCLGENFIPFSENLIKDLMTFSTKAVGDLKDTISRYQEAKMEYLAYLLRSRKLEAEEEECEKQENTLNRCLEGNLEYRWNLQKMYRSRQKYEKFRESVNIKLSLLDEKRMSDLQNKLTGFLQSMGCYFEGSLSVCEKARIEMSA
eukprot:Nk52_evm35s1992 gene=Nk52_evmTU35s1992